VGELPAMYELRARKWLVVMRYFIDLKRARPGRIALFDTDALNAPTGAILEALRLAPRQDSPPRPTPPTNRGPIIRSDAGGQMLAACFEQWREEMTELYDEAVALRERL
jgi:hypothetical protein